MLPEGGGPPPPAASEAKASSRTSKAKAAVAIPTAASKSSWTWVASTAGLRRVVEDEAPPLVCSTRTRMTFCEPTRASTKRTMGSEKSARRCIAARSASSSAGRIALHAPKSRFQSSGAVAKREAAEIVAKRGVFDALSVSTSVKTSGQSRSRVVTARPALTLLPNVTDRGSVHAGRSRGSPFRYTSAGVTSSKNVALTIVGPAPPVPAVKKSKSTATSSSARSVSSSSKNKSIASSAMSALAPGQMPALTTARSAEAAARSRYSVDLTSLQSSVSSHTST
mmetsp:Transcript_12531/g.50373  ORF Transcript_12531/g.50373 Transcript_12531/m.50373 type:complete len:281 (-) Transcript_12531:526-1368(-)